MQQRHRNEDLPEVPKYSIATTAPNKMEPFEIAGRYGDATGDEADKINRNLIKHFLQDETARVTVQAYRTGGLLCTARCNP